MLKKTAVVIALFAVLCLLRSGPALASSDEADRMLETVKYLSGEGLKGRGIGTPELDAAARFIAERFEEEGLLPGGRNGSWYQEWQDPDLKVRMKNVVAVLPGENHALEKQNIVLGAHYDHLGLGATSGRSSNRGKIHPGADDNASGVAALLEAAHAMVRSGETARSVVFVAFTGEEEGRKGSAYYVRNERQYPVSQCIAMVNLDTVGRMEKDKLIAIGAGSAREWSPLFRDAGKALDIEIAEAKEELDASDQKSFLDAGVPAVQFFTGPNLDYHRSTDTPDKINGKGLTKVALLARATVLALANHDGPLTSTLQTGPKQPESPSGRKVTLGIVPDFTFPETGVRLSGVQPGSPAEQAGMRQGDVIIALDRAQIAGLKDLSEALKRHGPGDNVAVTFKRSGALMRTTAKLGER